MEKLLKVSLITVVYNNVIHIKDCIESVRLQNYPNIEYIVIDGGSTDGTVKILQANRHKIDIFVTERDRGLYDGLNKGLKLATGDVVGILHSDDLFSDKWVVNDIVKTFNETKADIVYGNGVYVDKLNKKIVRVYSSGPFKKWLIYFGWIPLHTTIFVKRTVFETHGLYNLDYSIASDYEISLRWFMNPDLKKHFFDRTIVRMRLGGKSTTMNLQRRKSKEDLQIIRKFHLWGEFTLCFKILRKIPQYIKPIFFR